MYVENWIKVLYKTVCESLRKDIKDTFLKLMKKIGWYAKSVVNARVKLVLCSPQNILQEKATVRWIIGSENQNGQRDD